MPQTPDAREALNIVDCKRLNQLITQARTPYNIHTGLNQIESFIEAQCSSKVFDKSSCKKYAAIYSMVATAENATNHVDK